MKIRNEKGLIKMWTDYVPVDSQAIIQLDNISSMPFIHKHIAVMPDVHVGMGATVGSVIATKGAIIPAAVGVDIGCGMMACKTNIVASDLPDNLFNLRCEIENTIPHGRSDNGGKNDIGSNLRQSDELIKLWSDLLPSYERIIEKHPGAKSHKTWDHLGTLGTGNHFIEICLDETGGVWFMLHSGSRGLGNRIGQYFISLAKKEMERWFINLPDKDLSYLTSGSNYFNDYLYAVNFAQQYALINRKIMMKRLIESFEKVTGLDVFIENEAINCHHNYVSNEYHFKDKVFVTRKGAVSAKKGELGIIPGNMGERSFIVEGKGNYQSFNSCSHGAGRVMSRTEARKKLTIEDQIRDTKGVECKKDESVIDESPKAYKNIDDVMKSQDDLVSIKYTLKQILCVKG